MKALPRLVSGLVVLLIGLLTAVTGDGSVGAAVALVALFVLLYLSWERRVLVRKVTQRSTFDTTGTVHYGAVGEAAPSVDCFDGGDGGAGGGC